MFPMNIRQMPGQPCNPKHDSTKKSSWEPTCDKGAHWKSIGKRLSRWLGQSLPFLVADFRTQKESRPKEKHTDN